MNLFQFYQPIQRFIKLDTLKENNKGNIRVYEKHTYRISYLIEGDTIYIVRLRYARKEPLEY